MINPTSDLPQFNKYTLRLLRTSSHRPENIRMQGPNGLSTFAEENCNVQSFRTTCQNKKLEKKEQKIANARSILGVCQIVSLSHLKEMSPLSCLLATYLSTTASELLSPPFFCLGKIDWNPSMSLVTQVLNCLRQEMRHSLSLCPIRS